VRHHAQGRLLETLEEKFRIIHIVANNETRWAPKNTKEGTSSAVRMMF